jgi:DICT domain-containing protein
VFADFAAPGGGNGVPAEVPLPADAPLLREWAVVVTAPSLSVALTAWEVPQAGPMSARERRFESIFTLDPAAVRTAAEVCVAAARAAGSVPSAMLTVLDEAVAAGPTSSHGVDSLVARAFDYLQQLPPGPRP